MEALIKKVAADAGISNEQAKIAIETVAAAIKEKMPAVMHAQIDTFINGGTMSDAMKKQLHEISDRTEAAMEEMRKRATEIADEMKNKINEAFKKY